MYPETVLRYVFFSLGVTAVIPTAPLPVYNLCNLLATSRGLLSTVGLILFSGWPIWILALGGLSTRYSSIVCDTGCVDKLWSDNGLGMICCPCVCDLPKYPIPTMLVC